MCRYDRLSITGFWLIVTDCAFRSLGLGSRHYSPELNFPLFSLTLLTNFLRLLIYIISIISLSLLVCLRMPYYWLSPFCGPTTGLTFWLPVRLLSIYVFFSVNYQSRHCSISREHCISVTRHSGWVICMMSWNPDIRRQLSLFLDSER